jgi:hypothetical protein
MGNIVETNSKDVEVWEKLIRASMAMPGARINRQDYLQKELSKFYSEDVVLKAIQTSPLKAGISSSKIKEIADSSISLHITIVTTTSFTAGIPGGWWMAGTIPADMTQFFWHITVILQKLAYLHGWPQLFDEDGELNDETIMMVTVFVGVMFGASIASKALGELSEKVAAQVVLRLPKEALTKYGIYNLAKQIAKWIGIKLTKDTFARAVSKAIPVISGFISGGITYATFSTMSSRLHKHLEELPLHKG